MQPAAKQLRWWCWQRDNLIWRGAFWFFVGKPAEEGLRGVSCNVALKYDYYNDCAQQAPYSS